MCNERSDERMINMANTGLKTSLNAIREISSEIYHRYIPEIDEDTDISRLSTPIFEVSIIKS